MRPSLCIPRLALLAWRGLALRSLPSEETALEAGTYRQRLENFQDSQYFGEIMVGGQMLRGVLDTGSYELVLLSKHCETCGVATAYNESASRLFVRGRRQREHTYGGGTCRTEDGRDEVRVGPWRAGNQSFWMAVQCETPPPEQAPFGAIIGLGPPGLPPQPLEAPSEKRHSPGVELGRTSAGDSPGAAGKATPSAQRDLDDTPSGPALVETLGVRTFSACFGRKPGSPAWLVWNDTRPEGRGGVMKAAVVGKFSWSVRVAGVGLTTPEPYLLGCRNGCGAVLDTGTSMLGVPTDIYTGVREHIMELNNDCSDISRFPTLTLNIDGNALSLPPDTYVGAVTGAASGMQGVRTEPGGKTGCQLLLMDLGTEITQFGPMLILGIPFFRHFYTTFDLGGAGGRSLYFAPAGDDCRPAARPPAAPASLRAR